jgi:hypothetical protein
VFVLIALNIERLVWFVLKVVSALVLCPFQVQFRAASAVTDKLVESELRLANLIQELNDRKAELGGLTVNEVKNTHTVAHVRGLSLLSFA